MTGTFGIGITAYSYSSTSNNKDELRAGRRLQAPTRVSRPRSNHLTADRFPSGPTAVGVDGGSSEGFALPGNRHHFAYRARSFTRRAAGFWPHTGGALWMALSPRSRRKPYEAWQKDLQGETQSRSVGLRRRWFYMSAGCWSLSALTAGISVSTGFGVPAAVQGSQTKWGEASGDSSPSPSWGWLTPASKR